MKSSSRGLTMIEMLLALTLTSLLTAALSMMIGQAASEREVMRDASDNPAWPLHLIDLLERDFRQAQWWAGADDRLVLIGLGRDGLPAQIEYRWAQSESSNSLIRKQVPLTEGAAERQDAGRVVGLDLHGLRVGPFGFGHHTNRSDTTDVGPRDDRSMPTLLINGRQVPLQALPKQINIELWIDEALPALNREVILG